MSCQQPFHRYKRGGHEHIYIPNHLGRQFAVTEPDQYHISETLGIQSFIIPMILLADIQPSLNDQTQYL